MSDGLRSASRGRRLDQSHHLDDLRTTYLDARVHDSRVALNGR